MEYLTKEGLEQLRKELDELKTIKRAEIARALKEASAFGDLSENAEYLEVKESQAFLEGRIEELEGILRNAQVIEAAQDKTIVHVGDTVALALAKEEYKFILVGKEQADPLNGKISPDSPLGKAILGRRVGDTFILATHKGNKKYRVTKIA